MKRPVIANRALPTRVPFWQTITMWLLMDRFNVDGWQAGIVWTIWTLAYLVCWVGSLTEREVMPQWRQEDEG